jgi:hypothetical protein
MLLPHIGDQAFLAPLFLLSPNHDGRAVGVVGTDIDATTAAQLLEANPYVGLDVFDQMAEMDRAVRVRKGCCDKDFGVVHLPAFYSRKAAETAGVF